MKNLPFYLLYLFIVLSFSCSNEASEELGSEGEMEEEENTSTTPCDFDLSNVMPNSTIKIDCVLDLEGQNINLPSNVNFDFDGGDIINGTINFSGGTIDGRLLSCLLTVNGDVKLKDPTFKLIGSRWNIVEGQTTSEIALRNRDIVEDVFALVQRLEGDTVEIDELDAFFEISLVTSTSDPNFRASLEGINVPSNFNLKMTENTNLRVFPNSRQTYALIAVREADNVTVTGGNLYGDRDTHDYSEGAQEWGYLVFLHAASNTTVTGVTMKDAMGDGMKIQSLKFFFDPDHIPAHNITVSQCIFDSNRRNNLSITGGNNIFIDDNEFRNASIDTNLSDGVAPGFAIDVEATRDRDDTGEFIFYERAEDIFITNNRETNSRVGGFTVAIGYDVTIEGNTVETGISYSLAYGTKIIGNTLIASEQSGGSSRTGIKAGRENADSASIFDNSVIGNTVTGFGIGIFVTNRDIVVEDNTIIDYGVGIIMTKLINAEIKNNTLRSEREGSTGISSSSTFLNNVDVYENDVIAARNPLRMSNTNIEPEESDYIVTLDNNTLSTPNDSSTLFVRCTGLDFINNNLDHQIEVFNCYGINFTGNSVSDSDDHGIHLREVNSDIDIINNTINVSDNRECVQIENTTNANEINVSGTICQ